MQESGWLPFRGTEELDANNIFGECIKLSKGDMKNVPKSYGTLFSYGSENHNVQKFVVVGTNEEYLRQYSNKQWYGWTKTGG